MTKHGLVAALLALAPLSASAQLPSDLGQRLADGYVRPAMTAFADQTQGLEKALITWCQQDRKSDVVPVQRAFSQVMQAWAGIEFLRFGPLVQGNRFEKLAFWPDTRGVMQRQVRTLLAAADPAALEPGALAARSVAMQGLPALEYVLYDTPGLISAAPGVESSYACRYAVAIAANVVTVATELQHAWSAEGTFGQAFTAPGSDNTYYRNHNEVAAEAVKALSTGLQFARDVKLLPVLGASMPEARAQRAAWWRSDMTVLSLVAGLEGMLAFYEAGHYQFPKGEEWVGPALTGEMNSAIASLKALKQPWQQGLTDQAFWQRLSLVGMILKNAKSIVDEHIAPALGVTIGFNALDGD